MEIRAETVETMDIVQIPRNEYLATRKPRSRIVTRTVLDSFAGIRVLDTQSPIFITEVQEAVLMVKVQETPWFLQRTSWTTPTINYLMAPNVYILIRSPNATWWAVDITTYGAIKTSSTTYSGTPQTADWIIYSNQFLAYNRSGVYRRLYVSDAIIRTPTVTAIGVATTYSANVAFDYPYGPVFEEGGVNRRLMVGNNGVLKTPIA